MHVANINIYFKFTRRLSVVLLLSPLSDLGLELIETGRMEETILSPQCITSKPLFAIGALVHLLQQIIRNFLMK